MTTDPSVLDFKIKRSFYMPNPCDYSLETLSNFNYNCENFINVSLIENNMKIIKKIDGYSTCHFEIWEK